MIGKLIPVASQFQLVAIAVDIMHGHAPSYGMCLQLQPKKTKVRLLH